MNKTYRSIFNEQTGTYVAAAETTKKSGKKSKLATVLFSSSFAMMLFSGSQTAHAQAVILGGSTATNQTAGLAFLNRVAGGAAPDYTGASGQISEAVAVGQLNTATDGSYAFGRELNYERQFSKRFALNA